MEAFIRHEWANDQAMFLALKNGIDFFSLNRDGATIEVSIVYSSTLLVLIGSTTKPIIMST